MLLTDQSRIIKVETALLQELDNEAVLLNLADNQYYRLDAGSLHMFNVLISSSDFAGAVESLAREYNISTGQLRLDLEQFIAELVDAGVVEVFDEPAA